MMHTPGPWHQYGDGTGIAGPDGQPVAQVFREGATWPANAQLIVASPELLAVLTKHYATIAGHMIRLQAAHEDRAAAEWLCVAQDFASVIAKAEGRQP